MASASVQPGAISFKTAQGTDVAGAKTNLIYFHPSDAAKLEKTAGNGAFKLKGDPGSYLKHLTSPYAPLIKGNYIQVQSFIYCFEGHPQATPGTVVMNGIQRKLLNLSLNQEVPIVPFRPTTINVFLNHVKFSVDFQSKAQKDGEYEVKELSAVLKTSFANQIFALGQTFLADVKGKNLIFTVMSLKLEDLSFLASGAAAEPGNGNYGTLFEQTEILFERAAGAQLTLRGQESMTANSIFTRPTIDFNSMGIGGMDEQFKQIFRRAFAPRVTPPAILAKYGINPVKGILLYGPPGTGKTLMAREIGKMLGGKEPVIVNGPEILDKFVGESEKKVRELFAPAEEEWALKGPESDLHVIVLDELDAICKQRGKGSTASAGVGDTVVNQFLAKMDGYRQQTNILIIGMTNRKDMIDDALLRPGRLEVHIEIALPDENGRIQIFQIHTATMQRSGILDSDVDLKVLASKTKNFSGAEIMGLVQNASTYSLNRHIDMADLTHPFDMENMKVTMSDFEAALKETKPAFGVAETGLSKCIPNGIWEFGPACNKLISQVNTLVSQVRVSDRTPLVTVLLEGPPESGKTALAAHLALKSQFPFAKIISPEDLVGYSEREKLNQINETFENAYRSPLSLVIVDDLERLLEYVRIGPHFSNIVLQGLLVLLKKTPPPGHKLLIIATASNRKILEALEFMQVVNAVFQVPLVRDSEEIASVLKNCGFKEKDLEVTQKLAKNSIPIKKLIMLAEMAQQSEGGSLSDRFARVMTDLGDDF